MKIRLRNKMETMFIPLYGKAKMSEMGISKTPMPRSRLAGLTTIIQNCANISLKKKGQNK